MCDHGIKLVKLQTQTQIRVGEVLDADNCFMGHDLTTVFV